MRALGHAGRLARGLALPAAASRAAAASESRLGPGSALVSASWAPQPPTIGGAHSVPTYSGLGCTTGSLNEFVLFCCARLRTRPRVRGRAAKEGVAVAHPKQVSVASAPDPPLAPRQRAQGRGP